MSFCEVVIFVFLVGGEYVVRMMGSDVVSFLSVGCIGEFFLGGWFFFFYVIVFIKIFLIYGMLIDWCCVL